MQRFMQLIIIIILLGLSQAALSKVTATSLLYAYRLDIKDAIPYYDYDKLFANAGQILSHDGQSLIGHTITKIYQLDFGLSNHPVWTILMDAAQDEYGQTMFYGDMAINKNHSELYGIMRSSRDGGGKIFSYNIHSHLTTILHEFKNDGLTPVGVNLSPDGKFLYGVAKATYDNCDDPICKTSSIVYRLPLNGQDHPPMTVLLSFTDKQQGYRPNGKLVFTVDGQKIFGSTARGGSKGGGTIFQLTLNGTNNPWFETIYSFTYADDREISGSSPLDIILSKDGKYLYGTAYYFDVSNAGYIFQLKLFPSEKPFTEWDLFRNPDNSKRKLPGHLILSDDGKFLYGKTSRSLTGYGKSKWWGSGMVFQINLEAVQPIMTSLSETDDDATSLAVNANLSAFYWGYYGDYDKYEMRDYFISELR